MKAQDEVRLNSEQKKIEELINEKTNLLQENQDLTKEFEAKMFKKEHEMSQLIISMKEQERFVFQINKFLISIY